MQSLNLKHFMVSLWALLICAAQSQATVLAPPKTGIYHGAFPDFSEYDVPVWAERIDEFEYYAGKKIVWAEVSNDWADGIRFPWDAVEAIKAKGKVPYIRVLPRTVRQQGQGLDPILNLQNIINGDYDNQLRAWVEAARDYGLPLIVEFAPEPNGDWYSWGAKWNGGGRLDGYGDMSLPDGPERYRDAYRKFITMFREAGGTNVTWFFHLNHESVPAQDWNRMAYYYPGDDYIDWLGISAFGALYTSDFWEDLTTMLDRAMPEFEKVSATKPLALVEFGVIEDRNNLNRKADWLRKALTTLRDGVKYPRIKAISYWNERPWSVNNTDLRFYSSQNALNVYWELIKSPLFVTMAEFTQ